MGKKISLLFLALFFILSPSVLASNNIVGEATRNLKIQNSSSEASNLELVPEDTDSAKMIPEQVNFLYGEDNRYGVYYKDSGEAVVIFSSAFTNPLETDLKEKKINLKNYSIKNMVAYQIIRQPSCQNWGQFDCIKYFEEADYYSHWSEKTTYLKAKTQIIDDSLVIELPRKVKANKQGAYLLIYNLFNSATTQFGGSVKFNFSTLDTNAASQRVSVGIDSQLPRFFRDTGVESSITMQYPVGMLQRVEKSEFRSTQLDSVISSLGYGTVSKSANFLMPNEVFSVKGQFGPSWFSVYLTEILFFIIAFLSFVVIFGVAVFFVFKKRKQLSLKNNQSTNLFSIKSILMYNFISFVDVLLIVAVLAISFFLKGLTLPFMYLQPYSTDYLIGVLSTLKLSFLVFFPVFFLLYKKGLKTMLIYVANWLIWFFVIAVVFIMFYLAQSLGNNNPPIKPMPILKESLNETSFSAPLPSPDATTEIILQEELVNTDSKNILKK